MAKSDSPTPDQAGPEANEAAKRRIFEMLEIAWNEIDKANNRVIALTSALELAARQEVVVQADKFLLEMIDDTMESLWQSVDGAFSDLRDDLGIKTADYQSEASNG